MLGSCGQGPDFYFLTSNSRDVVANTEVRWNNVAVGYVSEVHFTNDQFRVDVRLKTGFRGRIREGATARIATEFMNGKPIVKINGGGDHEPPIKCGAQIPEFKSFVDLQLVKPWLSLLAPKMQHQLSWLANEAGSPEGEAVLRVLISEFQKIREGANPEHPRLHESERALAELVDEATKKFQRRQKPDKR